MISNPMMNPYRFNSRSASRYVALGSALAGTGMRVGKWYKRRYGQQSADQLANTIYRGYKKRARVAKKVNKKIRKSMPLNKLKSQVRELQKQSKSDQGELIYRARDNLRVTAAVNSQAAGDVLGYSAVTLESVLANCKFFNPSVPGTLTTADLSSGTFQRDIHFKRAMSKIIVRNNYQVPARVRLYGCVAKEDTGITPRTTWVNGLADIGSAVYTDAMTYPSDSRQFTDIYKVAVSLRKTLEPGQECELSYSSKEFDYDPSLYDSHNLAYLSEYGCHGWIIIVEGVMGHDTAADEQGALQAAVDVAIYRNFKVLYPAGANLRLLATSDGFSTFTNGGVVSSKPVSDNIGYSVA